MAPLLNSLRSPKSLQSVWAKVRNLPGGGRIMGEALGVMAPYTGTIHAEIVSVEPGRAQARMKDARRVRNHLGSIHAMALANLGELATGLAINFGLPPDARGILTKFQIEYLVKARGAIVATATCPVPETNEKVSYEVRADLADESGNVVAKVAATWLIGPVKK